jgi:hypothetical protein
MSEHEEHARQDSPARPKPNNLRTALWLAALALFFFAILFVKRLWMH